MSKAAACGLLQNLSKQFAAAQNCPEIWAHGFEPVVQDQSKIHVLPEANAPNKSTLPALAIMTSLEPSAPAEIFPDVGSVALVAPAFGQGNISQKIEEIEAQYPDARISVFKCGRILDRDDSGHGQVRRDYTENVVDTVYPILSQFLPARYREIDSKHLAQAIRLNFETCNRMYSHVQIYNHSVAIYPDPSRKVEYLDFVDCMKIIGLEDRI